MDCSPLGSFVHGMSQARILAWSGLPFLSPGDLPDPGIEPMSLALADGVFTTEPPGKFFLYLYYILLVLEFIHPLGIGNY